MCFRFGNISNVNRPLTDQARGRYVTISSQKLKLGASALVLLAHSVTASAQENPVESVIVSGSRISLQGFEAPTPVVQLGLEKIERDAKIDIGDLIRELPATGPSPSLNNGANSTNVSQGDAGLDMVNLRNLGIAMVGSQTANAVQDLKWRLDGFARSGRTRHGQIRQRPGNRHRTVL